LAGHGDSAMQTNLAAFNRPMRVLPVLESLA
jgi:hypothetical protein